MKAKHTPLPWEVIGTGCQTEIIDSSGGMICGNFYWNDQAESNAEVYRPRVQFA